MGMDFLALLRRDHHELDRGLAALVQPPDPGAELRGTLDGVRLGLGAHVAAEDIVLSRALERCADRAALEPLIERARRAHHAQERAFSALLCVHPRTLAWRARAVRLRALVRDHASAEEATLVPSLRTAPDLYASLAAAFATERLQQLALLQPSEPVLGTVLS